MLAGDVPTISEWSTILLPTKVHLMLKVWQYYQYWLNWNNKHPKNNVHSLCFGVFIYIVWDKSAMIIINIGLYNVQNITRIMCIIHALLCFVVVWYRSVLSIFFRVTSLALGQSYDCPSASEVILKNMGKSSFDCPQCWWSNPKIWVYVFHESLEKYPNHVHILWDILWMVTC